MLEHGDSITSTCTFDNVTDSAVPYGPSTDQEMCYNFTVAYSGLFFGFAFGMGGLGAALRGRLADRTSIDFVCHTIAYLPLLGAVAALLPGRQRASSTSA